MAEPSRALETVETVDGAHFLIIEARFYDEIGELLLEGATRSLLSGAGALHRLSCARRAGNPVRRRHPARRRRRIRRAYAGVIALGCVIRGETYHFEIVAGESSRALMDLSVARKLPIGNGILTVENEEQAIVRADPRRPTRAATPRARRSRCTALASGEAR